MVMISPCSGCDSTTLARILALFEAISGITTIIKSAWWYWFFRIPKESRKNNPVQVSRIANNADSGESCALQIPQKQVISPNPVATSTAEDVINIEPTSATPPEGCDQIRIDLETDAISETYSIGNELSDSNADNVLWTITGFVMGSVNIALGLFLLLGLANVNYVYIVAWCLFFPLFYLLDCVLFTFLLKHCTSKERFDRCRSQYISNTILSFVFNSYVLWVAISVLVWCNCRRDPYRCRFQRDYCHSLNINGTEFGGDDTFYD